MTHRPQHTSRIFRPWGPARQAACVSVLALAAAVTDAARAQIVADPAAPRGQQATVLRTANGLPQVDIRTPSPAGVSRNSYSQFDVTARGAILNNSRTSTPTQQAGWVQGNPWLAAAPARIILNEVNSSNPSLLQGHVEVAGQRAEVVIANPSGIVVNGGGFINASRATLTTGSPWFGPGGSLDGFSVREGRILIQGDGLNATGTDYTALLARVMRVEGGVWAPELRVVTGVNDVSADGAQVSPVADEAALRAGPARGTHTAAKVPARAIDVAQLGGLYAGRIFLIATEAGVGVGNAGQVIAGSGGLQLDAAGNLTNTGYLSSEGPARLQVTGMSNAGTLTTRAALAIDAAGPVANHGAVVSQGDLNVRATQVMNAGDWVADGALAVQAAQVANTGGWLAPCRCASRARWTTAGGFSRAPTWQ